MQEDIRSMRAGYISPRAKLGKRVYISPSAQLFGNVVVEDDSVIDSHVTLGYPTAEAIRACLGEGGHATAHDLLDQAVTNSTFIGRGSLVRSFAVIYEGVRIGEKLDCAHEVIVREGCSLGSGVELGPQTYIKPDAIIGNFTRIAATICDRALIGSHCTVYGDVIHKFTSGISGMKEESPVLEDGVVVGRRACVIGPVTIGQLALVGAGSVVTHSVAAKTVVAGNPAQFLRARQWDEAAELWSRVLGSDQPDSVAAGQIY